MTFKRKTELLETAMHAIPPFPKTIFPRKRPASSMVMVDRGEIFSKGKMATK